eukprot:GHVH01006001.1.p1 GENE.GHVH01006001.1~~GHVH01006001.1.p1  ORF type:complete len:256 (-),score=31.81 GHVH01006001.1:1118-1885(-)
MSQSQGMYDRHITVFSPEGKLYQVEYAFRAVKGAAMNAIAMKGKNCSIVACQKKCPNVNEMQQEKLLDTSHITSMYQLCPGIGVCVIGQPADARSLVFRMRQICAEFAHKNGFDIPISHLATKVGDVNQLYTQHAYMRLLAATIILIGFDLEDGPKIFKVDPAGFVAGYFGTACGPKEQEAANVIEKIFKKSNNEPKEQNDSVVQDTIRALQRTLGQDIKADGIEVAIVSEANGMLIQLGEDEIEKHLDEIARGD